MIRHMTVRDRKSCPRLFRSMHEDRKQVFVDKLKWDLRHDGVSEQDQYDTPYAQYLILRDEANSEHLGSVRLLPTTRGHILGDVFPFLCSDGVPSGPEIWEITRLVVSPRANTDPDAGARLGGSAPDQAKPEVRLRRRPLRQVHPGDTELIELDPALGADSHVRVQRFSFVGRKLVIDVPDDQFFVLTHRIHRFSVSLFTPACCNCFRTTLNPW